MTLFYEIEDKLRFIVIFQDVSESPSKIHSLTGISLSTINNWIHKLKNDIDILEVQKGRGSKVFIDDTLKEEVIEEVKKNPYQASTRKLGVEFEIGKSSVQMILEEEGFKYDKLDLHKILTVDEKLYRIKFCEDMIDKTRKLHATFFCDESGLRLSDAHPQKVWTQTGNKCKIEKFEADVRVNFWGGISYKGATSLEIYSETLTGNKYREILEAHTNEMSLLYPHGFNFIQDNLRIHNCAHEWCDENPEAKIRILQFPTYSPDLNPIENIWGMLKDAVRRDGPKTLTALRESLLKNWTEVTREENLHHLIDSMNNRFITCIQGKGDWISY